jgi:hypothetical protein
VELEAGGKRRSSPRLWKTRKWGSGMCGDRHWLTTLAPVGATMVAQLFSLTQANGSDVEHHLPMAITI